MRPTGRLGLVVAIVIPALVAGAVAMIVVQPFEGSNRSVTAEEPSLLGAKPLLLPSAAPPGRLVVPGARRPAPPARISIPTAGVAATVEAVRATTKGIEVPPVQRVGWFGAGPRPGEIGRAVLIGHLDSSSGPAVFSRLPGVKRGSAVTILDRRGKRHRYRVTGRRTVLKSRFPSDAVYGVTRGAELVLITCGGPYREGVGYRDNVLVYASAT